MKEINYTEMMDFYNNMTLHEKEYLIMLLTRDITIAVETKKGCKMINPEIDDICINGTAVQIFVDK